MWVAVPDCVVLQPGGVVYALSGDFVLSNAFAFALAFALALAYVVAGADEFEDAFVRTNEELNLFIGAYLFALAFAVAGAVAGAFADVDVDAGAFAAAVVVTGAFAGAEAGRVAGAGVATGVVTGVAVFAAAVLVEVAIEFANAVGIKLPDLSSGYSLIIAISMLIGFISSQGISIYNEVKKDQRRFVYNLRPISAFGPNRHWVWTWLPLAFIVFYGFGFFPRFQEHIQTLAFAFLLIPVVGNGLLHYPLQALLSLYHFWNLKKCKRQQSVHLPEPWRGQGTVLAWDEMVILPLPYLARYLEELCGAYANRGHLETGLAAISYVAQDTFQYKAGQKAARRIIHNPETAHAYALHLFGNQEWDTLHDLARESELAWAYYQLSDHENVKKLRKQRLAAAAKAEELSLFKWLRFSRQQMADSLKPDKPQTHQPEEPELFEQIAESLQIIQRHANYAHQMAAVYVFEGLYQFTTCPDVESFHRRYRPDLAEHLVDYQDNTLFGPMLTALLTLHNIQREFVEIMQEPLKPASKRDLLINLQMRLKDLAFEAIPYFGSLLRTIQVMWEAYLEQAVRNIVNTAQLEVSDYAPKTISSLEPADVRFTVINRGEGPARNVRLEGIITEADNYELVSIGQPHRYLEPSDPRIITVTIRPLTTGPIVLHASLIYDDNEKPNRRIVIDKTIDFISGKTWAGDIVNPYLVGRPITDPRTFVGRQDVIRFVRQNLRAGNQFNALILYGERRMGKTSALYRVMDVVDADDISWGFVDVQGVKEDEDTLPQFFYQLARKLTRIHKELRLVAPELADFEKGWKITFDEFLADFKQAAKRPVVLIMDEFDELETFGTHYPGIMDYMRSIIQHSGIGFIIAGTYRLLEHEKTYESTFFNIGMKHKIGLLSAHNTSELVTRPVQDTVFYSEAAREHIWGLTAGHPYFIQKICRSLITRLNEHKRATVSYDDVQDVVQPLTVDEGILDYWYYKSSTAEEQQVMDVISSLISEKDREYPSMAQLLESPQLDMTEAELKAVLARLQERDLIRNHRSGGGTAYDFKMKLMRMWVANQLKNR